MTDDRLRDVDEAAAGRAPAVAEVAVLRCSREAPPVEPADRREVLAAKHEVVGRQEARVGALVVQMRIDEVLDVLAGRRVRVVGEVVDGLPAARNPGAERGRQTPQPVAIRLAVVVGEGDHVTLGCSRARISCRSRAAPSHPQDADAQLRRWRQESEAAPVVDDDHLEPLGGVVEPLDRGQAARQRQRAIARGDDDRDARGQPATGSSSSTTTGRRSSAARIAAATTATARRPSSSVAAGGRAVRTASTTSFHSAA